MLTAKKVTAVILLLALTLSFAIMPVRAESAEENSELKNHMLRILASVEHEKEFYGLKDVDFSKVTIGNQIPSYVVIDGALVPSNIQIFPVLRGGQVRSLFLATELPNGELYVQLGTELVSELTPYIKDKEFAIIYDDVGAHIYIDKAVVQIAVSEAVESTINKEATIVMSEFEDVAASSSNLVTEIQPATLEAIETSDIAGNMVLNVNELPLTQNSSRAVVSRTLNVDIFKQPSGTSICWAITTASIVNYIFDYNLTYPTIVDQFNGGNDTSMATSTVINKLNYYYNADYEYVASGKPSMTTILNELAQEKPVYGDFVSHAAVIRGANSSTRTFSVMNPSPSTTGYTAGTVSSSNVWSFISAHSNKTYTLRYYGRYSY